MSKLHAILETLNEKKADCIKVYDLSQTEQIHHTMIVCNASNHRLLHALKDHVEERLNSLGYSIHHSEGQKESEWLLLDVYDVLVHLFLDETRWYYHLDELWADQPNYEYKES